MTVNVYDQASRYGVQPDSPGFYRWLPTGLDPAVTFQGWLDTRTLPFPGLRDRTCDTVADLAAAADAVIRWALVTEFQTEPDPEILDRILEYVARLRRELRCGPHLRDKYQVVAAVVNLTGAPQDDSLEMSLPGLASPVVRVQAVTRTMREEDAAFTLDCIAAGEVSRCLLSWISPMRGGSEPDAIERWREAAGDEPNDSFRATYGALVVLFAELTNCVPQWQAGLEGWNMRESTVVAGWRAEGRTVADAGVQDLRRVW